MDVKKLLEAGRAKLDADHSAQERAKAGILRVGTSGIIIPVNGAEIIIGHCARKAMARTLGFQQPVEENRHLMFGGGLANEDAVVADLTAGLPAGFTLKREEEIGVSFKLSDGTEVSGRPDIVLCDAAGAPVSGIECKAVCSIWTAKAVGFERNPKTDHLIQAGIYAKLLGVPYTLVYSSRVDWVVPDWAARKGWFNGHDEITERNARGDVNKILPFEMYYDLIWNDDSLFWAESGADEWHPTAITWDSVLKFYETVAAGLSSKTLPARPAPIDVSDTSKTTFDACDAKYCQWAHLCDRHEADFSKWIKEVAKISK